MQLGISYAVGRLSAVVARPLCLFAANNYFTAEAAQGLAVAFLASALGLIVIAAGPHRRFYMRLFARDHCVNGLTFYLYASSLILLVGVGCVFVFAIGLFFMNSLALAVAGVTYFFSEKLADELLRLRLYERDFEGWGRTSIVRSLLQLTSLAALLVVTGQEAPAWLAVLVLSSCNLLVFVPQMPNRIWRNVRPGRSGTALWLARRAAHSLLDNRILWALALITASVGYLDRVIALVLDTAILPLFMLVAMCFSVVQMAVDFIYLSRYRRDFLERRMSIGRAFTSREFLGSFSAGLAIAGLASIAVLHFSHNGAEFPLGYVFAIGALQVSLAIAIIPAEILYWSHGHGLGRMFCIELVFWALFSCAVFVGWWLGLPVVGFLGLAVACAFVRLVLYVAAAAHCALATWA